MPVPGTFQSAGAQLFIIINYNVFRSIAIFFDVSIPNAMVTGFALLRTFLLPGAQCVPVWEPYPPPDVEKADPQLFFRLI